MPGYQGSAFIDGVVFLCTSATVPRARPSLESSSGYGGRISTPTTEIGIGSPYVKDWPTFDGSVNFELTQTFFTDVLKDWIFNRQTSKQVTLKPRGASVSDFLKCYWSSISLSVAEGSAVTGSMNFTALNRNTYTVTDDYLTNIFGTVNPTDLQPGGAIPALNEFTSYLTDANINPVSFWNTKAYLNAALQNLAVSWDLSMTQNVVKFFTCPSTASTVYTAPIQPTFVAVGPMSVTWTIVIVPLMVTYTVLITPPTGQIDIGSEVLNFQNLELNTDDDGVKAGSDMTPLSLEYQVYGLSA